jgi:MoCo/4Fe-4S cofactor protein with predicted Tat translocation signal
MAKHMKDLKPQDAPTDLVQIAAQPGSARARFWRSVEEWEGDGAVEKAAAKEFPRGRVPNTGPGGLNRRDLLKIMGASAGLAGLTACTKLPPERIVPYVRQPEEFVPGIPLFYATAMPFGGVGRGLLVESHMGRPTKVEGNPDHSSSLGGTDVFGQASVLTLYDPDRSQTPSHFGKVASWEQFIEDLGNHLVDERSTGGKGLRILTGTITSPTLADQIQSLLNEFPGARWHQYEPCGRDAAREGSRLAFGQYASSVYRLDKAEVVLSLDSDFMFGEPGSLRYARDFAGRRRMTDPSGSSNRLYAVESTPSVTGSLADHRLQLRSSAVEGLARALASAVGVGGGGSSEPPTGVPADWIAAVANDLKAHRGASLVVTGDRQPAAVHALVHAMNQALGNAGQTVVYTAPLEANPTDETKSLKDLVTAMDAGQVRTLILMGVNPIYNAPADVPFLAAMQKVDFRVHLGLFIDETAAQCHWQIPEAHYLEAWGDVRCYDGTVSIIQPLIAPLYGGRSALEMLAILRGQTYASAHDMVRDYWQREAVAGRVTAGGAGFENFWETSLNNGWVEGTAFAPKQAAANAGAIPASSAAIAEGLELVLLPSPSLWDGSLASNAWLQELPQPFTKLTWDNALLISPGTAAQLGLKREDVVKVQVEGREISAPVFTLPGQATNSLTLHLGYGRTLAGAVGTGVGANAYSIRTSLAPWIITGVRLAKTNATYHLVTTQNNHLIEQNGQRSEEESDAAFDRRVVRVGTLDEYRSNPEFAQDPPDMTTEAESLYPPYDYSQGYSWGMSIDLNTCIGCNACVVACYAENNIAVVGKDEVDNGRDMQWIRVDTYFRGDLENPEAYNEIMLCQHCENAPCEYVCPVGATVHSPEGLNLMVYNRCVGTRYCSNNCPYKVRRFNFKLYSDWETPSFYPLRNPDVTVRSRGVMEKCTYCVQRIMETKIKAEREDRVVEDGEILTACQQTCPTEAIVFGNLNDPNSKVTKLKAQRRDYGLLRDLNTRPRTTYLARLKNPNPEIKG